MIAYKQRVMDMDKQEQAQRFAEILLKTTHANHGHLSILELENISETAYSLADYMQAEADKRKTKPELPSLQQTFIDGVEQPRYAPSLDDWQPDWSQAPDGFNIFVVASVDGYGFFTNTEPQLYEDYYYAGRDAVVFHNHGYTGPWQQSLRKRPEGV